MKTSQQASHPPFGVLSLLMISSRKVKTSLPTLLALPTCDGALSVVRMSLLSHVRSYSASILWNCNRICAYLRYF